MKKQVVYIHGGESFIKQEDYIERLKTVPLWHMETDETPEKWTSTLTIKLGPDFEVIMPPMPNKQNAKFSEWSIWFERHFEYLHDGVVLIGCSLGAMFIAKYLTMHELPFKPSAIILMAGAYELPGFSDASCGEFLVKPEDVTMGCANQRVIIMHSKDDPVVPFEHGLALSQAFPSAEFVEYTDKNHFLVTEFPEIVQIIKSL